MDVSLVPIFPYVPTAHLLSCRNRKNLTKLRNSFIKGSLFYGYEKLFFLLSQKFLYAKSFCLIHEFYSRKIYLLFYPHYHFLDSIPLDAQRQFFVWLYPKNMKTFCPLLFKSTSLIDRHAGLFFFKNENPSYMVIFM